MAHIDVGPTLLEAVGTSLVQKAMFVASERTVIVVGTNQSCTKHRWNSPRIPASLARHVIAAQSRTGTFTRALFMFGRLRTTMNRFKSQRGHISLVVFTCTKTLNISQGIHNGGRYRGKRSTPIPLNAPAFEPQACLIRGCCGEPDSSR